ncbi:SDR family NAD(P)-dependent oxidoreductase [Mycobacterium paraseoulense]|uniref:Retinol dehydrogenase n=1 Tax=Mycobacterium paraseoulense TaxID=590652 RepID=A0A1X0IAW3_9MYCO|nr:SDR family NAD(P)-dependent oxidoreductase [Mycobacterium paraseoulense]MCV7397910.1 SDR family NAD(P)-dependent oxidoreductase [Mycobacterium paraseoulense]ORB40990.1 retinol dehydrogenase [Mycobacterium paraseoulense]BBZ70355.1 short-chain dehydrogenase [Mycobacterium paraseoulense]
MKVIVTGANSGVGKATAAILAAAGHQVVLACRTPSKGLAAAREMRGDVSVARLDLADLSSVRAFADSVDSVDVLINNAGVLGLPLTHTADGFEAHIGTNHLGHFALTCLLADRITDRVVTVTSSTYAMTRLHLDDLNWEHRTYDWWSAYTESKLANAVFTVELARRGLTAHLSDPGVSDSDILSDLPGIAAFVLRHLQPYIAQPADLAARSTVLAATMNLPSPTYWAPRGLLHLWGKPKVVDLNRRAHDPDTGRRLWEISAELTGCDLPLKRKLG